MLKIDVPVLPCVEVLEDIQDILHKTKEEIIDEELNHYEKRIPTESGNKNEIREWESTWLFFRRMISEIHVGAYVFNDINKIIVKRLPVKKQPRNPTTIDHRGHYPAEVLPQIQYILIGEIEETPYDYKFRSQYNSMWAIPEGGLDHEVVKSVMCPVIFDAKKHYHGDGEPMTVFSSIPRIILDPRDNRRLFLKKVYYVPRGKNNEDVNKLGFWPDTVWVRADYSSDSESDDVSIPSHTERLWMTINVDDEFMNIMQEQEDRDFFIPKVIREPLDEEIAEIFHPTKIAATK